METAATRLKKAREDAGFTSAREAALAAGWSYDTYAQHENGTRGYPAKKAAIYARRFRVAAEWLLYGRGDQVQASIIPNEDELIEMVQLALDTEVTMETRRVDLPRIVGSNLHTQLQRRAVDLAPQETSETPRARGKGARSASPTTKVAPVE